MTDEERLIFSFEVYPVGERLVVTLELANKVYDDPLNEAEFQLKITSAKKKAVVQSIFINPGTLEVRTSALMALDPLSTCLIACAGASVVGRLLECADGDLLQYMKCLRSKGLTLAADALKCAMGCIFGSGGAGSP